MSFGCIFKLKILIYPYIQKYVLNRGPTLFKITPPALTLRATKNLRDFTPKLWPDAWVWMHV